MSELGLLIFALALRFLFFDYKLFKGIRAKLYRLPFFKTVLTCPFCQGFWCGFIIFIIHYYIYVGLISYFQMFYLSFIYGMISAILSLTWYVLVIPKLDLIESDAKNIYEEEKNK